MIHSMTAFARESADTPHGSLTVELRSVNHRYLDCSFKLPDNLRSMEGSFREGAGRQLGRGKLDCVIRLQSASSGAAGPLSLNRARLGEVLQVLEEVTGQLPGVQAVNPLDLLQFPGVCSSEQGDEEVLRKAADTLFQRALQTLRDNRAREGDKLAHSVLERLKLLDVELAAVRNRVPQLLRDQRQRVIERIEQLQAEVDPGRLEQELVFMAQKADVDEELDRLEAHIAEVRRALDKGGPCGRRLDFLMQELNREANTLSSKSTAASTTQSAVELKVLIEQMREQIQNIE